MPPRDPSEDNDSSMEVITAPPTPQQTKALVSTTGLDPSRTERKSSNSSSTTVRKDPALELKYRRRALGLPTTAITPAVPDHPAVQKMQRLVAVFEHEFLPGLKAMYQKALEEDRTDDNGWYRGVRRITGARYEIKVLGDYFTKELTVNGFDKSLPWAMVEYAEAQAKRDEKVQAMMRMPGGELTFSDWSIIISQKCEAQTIHTDVPVNNVQFGLIMNSARRYITPGTKVVLQEDFGPHTVEELLSGIWADAPQSLRECMLERPLVYDWCNKILNVFGPMLQRIDVLEANMAGAEVLKRVPDKIVKDEPMPVELESTDSLKASTAPLDCGDLICTSGGVPHAGPACDHFRMVMFGAASPTPAGLYDVDDQFFAHSALLYVIQAVWDHLKDDDEDEDGRESKIFLLRRLAAVSTDYDRSIANKHDTTSPLLTDFMSVILDVVEDEGSESNETIESVVQDFAQRHGSKTQAELFDYCPPGLRQAAKAQDKPSA